MNSVEFKLLNFIEDASLAVDNTTWFTLDRFYFETGSSTLKAESKEQLDRVAAILKAYPAVNLKIGGYTDNTGSDAVNMALSSERANAAMAELVNRGIEASRLEAEGYGCTASRLSCQRHTCMQGYEQEDRCKGNGKIEL